MAKAPDTRRRKQPAAYRAVRGVRGEPPERGVRPERAERAERVGTPPKPGRRDEILAIAAAVFARKGFAATTVRDIAAEAGILSGSLYHHFTSKNELFEEIIRTAVDADLARDAATAGASDFDAETALRSMVDRMLRNMATNPDVARILSTGLDGVHGTGAHTILQRRRQAMRASLTTILERGVQDGSFRPDLDVDLAYRMIVSSVDGLGRWFVPAGARSIEDVSADLTRMLLDAVRRTPSRRSRASADRS